MDWSSYPETYWHCYVALPGRKKDRDRAIINDTTRDRIRREVVEPWHQDAPFTVSGAVVKNQQAVDEIRIVQTPHPKKVYADEHNALNRASRVVDLATDRRLLPFAKGKDYTNELLFDSLSARAPAPDIALLLRICERLPDSARVLASRQRRKSPYIVADEYDVQDLLQAVIRAYFKYSVQEEPIGKVGGAKSARADLAIEDLGVIVEVKFVRGAADQNRIVEELAQDLLQYSKWQPLQTFIYMIYNSRDLRDPEALEKLGGDQEISGKKYRTFVVLAWIFTSINKLRIWARSVGLRHTAGSLLWAPWIIV